MICVPIQVELTEDFEEPEGTQYVAIGGYVTETCALSGPSVFRPYLLCVGEGGGMQSIPVDMVKFVTVLPQAVFIAEAPKGTGLVVVDSAGQALGAN